MASAHNQSANVDLFDAYFRRADLDRDGRISGNEAVAFFQGSGLPKQVLAQIWAHADQRQTGFLGRAEFYNALRLVTVAQSKRELTPEMVKAALYGPAAAKIPAPKINLAATPAPQFNSAPAVPSTQGGAVTPMPSQNLGFREPQVPPQYNSAAAAPATQGGSVTPMSSQNLGFRGPQVQSQFNSAPTAPSTQGGVVTPTSSQNLGFRGLPPSVNVNQNNFIPQDSKSIRPPVPPSSSDTQPSQGVAAQGFPRGGSVVGLHPQNSSMSNDWVGGATTGVPSQVVNKGVTPSATQDVFGLATSGPTTSLPPRPHAGFGIRPSGPPAKDSKPLNISGNGFAPDSSFGDDVFSATPSQPKQNFPPGSVPVSSGIVPISAGTQSSAIPSTQFGGEPQQAQSFAKPNQQVSAQTSPSGVSLGAGNSASSQSHLTWPRMTQTDVQKYTNIFVKVDTDRDGKITGEQARDLFVPVGRTKEESQKLLDQTAAAVDAIAAVGSPPSDFSAIENVSDIVSSAVSGKLLTINELCAVRRTLTAAKGLFEKVKGLDLGADCTDRYLPLIEILKDCDFLVELEKTIGVCIDCKLSIILDTASEDLEIIRSERKRNMENLDSLLKEVSTQIFKSGGIDSPLVTMRRARMCVGVRATHKHLLPGCIVLDASSSGATYFVEPKEAVELNNMEVRLSNAERAEEIGILSFLTSEIAKSEVLIMYLLDKVLEVDLAFARAAYALWMNGVCPIFSSKDLYSGGAGFLAAVDIEGLQHPLLVESSLKNLSDDFASRNPLFSNNGNGVKMISGSLSGRTSDFPVPIDIKIGCGTRVVVISGPNTGGKTASMKTLGLASLMSKAGMYLPAKNHPRLPWFDLVLADIGDHQSLEQNLSTFSGHISRIRNILEVASKESLVLIDEIGSGTDPSEGVALSASILLYLKDRVDLAVVTTHYADLSRLKEKDNQFENAAMEFSPETLQPTYRILWGSTGDSNALSIAKSIGFNQHVIEHAQKWVQRLMPEKQQERKGLLYRSLVEERNRLEAQAKMAASLHSDIMDIYCEIHDEAEDLELRKRALMAKETLQVQQEVQAAKSQMETVLKEFDNRLKIAAADQLNLLIRKSEAAIASVVEAHSPEDDLLVSETSATSFTPRLGEQVYLKRLGDKIATVAEAPGDDGTVLVQYGKIKVRLKKSDIRAIPSADKNATPSSVPRLKQQVGRSRNGETEGGEVSYGPAVQTSKNTVDLRGMRVEEASYLLDMVLSGRESQSVIFVIHGMGTGVVKERALEILKKHPRVAKYEPESSTNYGCTVAYIK